MNLYILYLAIANKVSESINMDKDSILLGSVIPNIFNSSNKSITFTNPNEFVLRYETKLDNPVVVGFLINILISRYYEDYVNRNFYVYDGNNNIVGLNLNGKTTILSEEESIRLKNEEFAIYDKWLLNHKLVPKFKGYNCLNNIIDLEEVYDRQKIGIYIAELNKAISKVNIFSKLVSYKYKITNQKELNNSFNECVNNVLDFLHKNNIK